MLKFNWTNHKVTSKTIRVPYGWKRPEVGPPVGAGNVSIEDELAGNLGMMVVDYELKPYIEQALNSINNGTSLRDAANWLTVATGKPLSHAGLKLLWKKVVVDQENTDYQQRLDTWKVPKTREEKKRRTLVKRRAAAKRAVTVNQKKLNRLVNNGDGDNGSGGELLSGLGGDIDSSLETPSGYDSTTTIAFQPNPGPQQEFLESSELEVLFGGAAGGEPKSWFTASLSE